MRRRKTPVGEINPRIQNRVREWCKKRDISLTELAGRMGRSQGTISMIANGKRLPGDDVLVELCDALNCKVGDLFIIQPDTAEPARK